MVEGHRLEDIVAVLDRLRADLAGHGPLRVGLNPRRVSESVATALAGAVAKDETDRTLEALASPIRRSVLHRLNEGPASFGDAMQSTGLVDSPKLSFHLRRLVDAGLVTHEGEEYRLTGRGEAAVRLLSVVNFLPPIGPEENLAFAARKEPRPAGDR
jgi:DNA-binding transcriptional ArsR family regulator